VLELGLPVHLELEELAVSNARRPMRACDWLRAEGRVFALEAYVTPDVPLVELRTDAMYKASNQVSIGQRCTCILPIVMPLGNGPLIVDQPEDRRVHGSRRSAGAPAS
jgi:hypothetical protein